MSRQQLSAERQNHFQRHLEVYRTDPDKGHVWLPPAGPDAPPRTSLLLTTKGRKTGNTITVPLIYGKVPTGYCIVASKGGLPEHPYWYENLLAEPVCDLQIAREHIRARARTATGDERAALWAHMVKIHPEYDDYQKLTTREIPVVVLEPKEATSERG